MINSSAVHTLTCLAFSVLLFSGCSDDAPGVPASASGGAPGVGGSSTGGTVSASGGTLASGGASGGTLGVGGSPVEGSGGDVQSGGAPSGGAAATGGDVGTGGLSTGGSGTGGTGDAVFHVFVLLGQSNMAGFAKAEQADKVEDPRVTVLGFDDCPEVGRVEGEWDVAAPPLHECWNGAMGPGDYFAKTLISQYPEQDTIGLVPCALSGEAVETFMKGQGTKYDWILARAQAALDAGGVIEGFLFHQGESNCEDQGWPEKVKTMVTDLRADLGVGDIPFLAGELLYSGSCANHNSLVNQLPGLVQNAHVVSAEGLDKAPDDTWNLHFSHDAQVTFGTRYAEVMIQALGL